MYKGLVSLSCLVAGLLHRLLLHIPSTLPSLIRPMPPASRVFHTSLDPVPLLSIFLRELVTLNLSQTCHYQICHSNSRLTYRTCFAHMHTHGRSSLVSYARGQSSLASYARGQSSLASYVRGRSSLPSYTWGAEQLLACEYLRASGAGASIRVFTPTNLRVTRLCELPYMWSVLYYCWNHMLKQ